MFPSTFNPYYKNSWALVIGINDYIYAGPLAYAANDADSIASVLTTHLNFPKNNVFLLKNKEATREKILETYLNFENIANSPDDRLFFFFAGHGYTNQGYQGQVGYLVPVNGDPSHSSTLIRWDELTRNADLIPAKHILFILDACFSGLALKRAVYPGSQRFLTEMLQRRSRQVVTAGKADEVVADGGGPQGKNSIFTGHLIEGLSGVAVDQSGILTANGLMYYVYQKLAQDPKSDQTPHYGHIDGDGDFVLIAPNDDLQLAPEHDQIINSVPELPGTQLSLANNQSQYKPSFVESNGYINPSNPSFGRNTYSSKLGIMNFGEGRKVEKSLSWLGIVLEPVTEQTININLSQVAKRFTNYSPTGDQPFERFFPPKSIMTSINSVILFDNQNHDSNEYWSSFVRIEKGGNIEFCDSDHAFLINRDIRAFRFVQIIGMVWQFMFFSKNLLEENNYKGAARLSINLIGTKDTILGDFARGTGKDNKHWVQPGARDAFIFDNTVLLNLKCPDANLQLQYNLVLERLNEQSAKEIILNLAEQLGLAYNHQSEPRCFDCGTDNFPWDQYFNERRY